MVNHLEKTLTNNSMNKKCNSCQEVLSFDHFTSNNGGRCNLRASCIKCEKLRKANYYIKNKDKVLLNKKNYFQQNKETINAKNTIYQRNKYQNNKLHKLKMNMSALIRHSMNRFNVKKGGKKTTMLIGCSIEEFRTHLESQFNLNMTWNNYGSHWSIDHICPCNQAQNGEELVKLQHFSNLKPMITYGPEGNFAKSDSKTIDGETLCFNLLNRQWID